MRSPVIAVFIAALSACGACAQRLENISTISLTKQTRAYFNEVVISSDSVKGMVENHRSPEKSRQYAFKTDPDKWAGLMLSLGDISLKDINGLQSPTMDRARDAAVQSSIVITLKTGGSVTHSFDDENPHPDLKPLLEAIKSMVPEDAGR